ncbi:DUF6204 family protein [Labedaea rhizosphaerae]|uniref:Uncharacterized protein n=1 Tax=Labedaea rhizosphaerae TaxID=598644 RepID=A0A4R6SPW5_LABRH|nr:DUF6204 family protein [Labedaea rhizosphaerae]TDQ05562.1 hypothetical protein EV186_1011536 [Labedaea rhizosphaerae]
MSDRTFRVLVRGRFTAIPAARRAELLADADKHDALFAEFTDEGTLTYDRSLTAFSVRCVIHAEEEPDAIAAGEAIAATLVAGTTHELRRTTATCMEDIKIRKRR